MKFLKDVKKHSLSPKNRKFISAVLALLMIIATISASASGDSQDISVIGLSAIDSDNVVTPELNLSTVAEQEEVEVATLGKSGVSNTTASDFEAVQYDDAILVSSIKELYEIAVAVNGGEDYSGKAIKLEKNLNFGYADEWVAIGTIDNPFRGVFDGNNMHIYGVGGKRAPVIFGYIENATLQNIKLHSIAPLNYIAPYTVLVTTAINSNVINCEVSGASPIAVEGVRSFAAVSAKMDHSWYNASATSYTITGAAQLRSLHQYVNVVGPGGRTIDTEGKTFTINVTDIGGEAWEDWAGIGTRDNPFAGTVSNSTIKGLTAGTKVDDTIVSTFDNVGVFGFTENALFDNVNIEDVKIAGSKNVGGLIGYAINTTVTTSRVSGSIYGSVNVGGLIGCYELNAGGDEDPPNVDVTYSYSTADVTGTGRNVGGIFGKTDGVNSDPDNGTSTHVIADSLFSTGSITGSNQVGGIAGIWGNDELYSSSYTSQNLASNANVKGINNVGGIFGVNVGSSMGGVLEYLAENSYFSGTVEGISALGGIVGGQTDVSMPIYTNVYVSGHVIAPNAAMSPTVWPIGTGDHFGTDSSGVGGNVNVWITPNAVYNSNNVLNSNKNDPTEHAYKKGDLAGGGAQPEHLWIMGSGGYNFFDDTPAMGSGNFTDYTLTFDGSGNPNTGSQYPTLNSFAMAPVSVSNAFTEFSTASTTVDNSKPPSRLYIGSDLLLYTDSLVSTVYTLPTGGTGWKVNGGTSAKVIDALTGKEISVSFTSGNIKVSSKLSTDTSIVLSNSVGGLNYSYSVVIADAAAAPNKVSSGLYDDKADVPTTSNSGKVPRNTHVVFFNFPEKIASGGAETPITLNAYSDNTFTPASLIGNTPVTVQQIGQTTLRFSWDPNFVEYDNYYSFNVDGANRFDEQGNPFDGTYYFASRGSSAPELSFTSHLLAAPGGTSTNQTIVMTANSPELNDLFDSISIVSDSNLSLYDDPDNAKLKTIVISLQNQQGYDSVDIDNLHMIPGTYVVEYTIEDTASGLTSAPIERTFKVSGESQVMQGGQPYKMLNASFSSGEMQLIFEKYEANKGKYGSDISKAVEEELNARYVAKAGDDQITSFSYGADTLKTKNTVSFTLSKAFTETEFWAGSEKIYTFTTEDAQGNKEEHFYMLSLSNLQATYEIHLENETYYAVNKLENHMARKHINARVYDRTLGEYVKVKVYYDFSDIDPYNFTTAQEVPITLNKDKSKTYVNGVDFTVETVATIVLQKDLLYVHPEDIPDVNRIFWEESVYKAHNHPDNTIHTYEIPVEAQERVKTDFFLEIANRKNVTAIVKYPNNISLKFNTKDVDKARITKMEIDLTLEMMYDMYINRDAGGLPTGQFVAPKDVTLPGVLALSIPVSAELVNSGDLFLYHINETTGKYEQVRAISEGDIVGGMFTMAVSRLDGRYIITAANLGGKETSTKIELD